MSTVFGRSLRVWLLASAFGVAACGGDGDGGNGPGGSTTTFTGILSQDDGAASGSVTFVVETANPAPPAPGRASLVAPVNITGTLTLGGSSVDLTGTYDPATGALTASGGGFTFDGVFDGSTRLEGIWSGPGGLSGTFVTTLSASAAAYCGTYDEDDDGSVDGTFSFVIAGGVLSGERYALAGGGPVPLDGVVNGNNIIVYFPGTQVTLATGTLTTGAASGFFDDQQGNTGSWTGSTAACQ